MQWIEFWLLKLLMWIGVHLFARFYNKRKNVKLSEFVLALLAIIIPTGFQLLLWGSTWWVIMLLRSFSACLLVTYIYLTRTLSLSLAIYTTIWSISIWQLVYQIWAVIKNEQAGLFLLYPLLKITTLLLLYFIIYLICFKTIIPWMQHNQKKTIGPKQMMSAFLLFIVVELFSLSPVFLEIVNFDIEWRYHFLTQLICLVILYLQNEMFKKSYLQEEIAIINLLWKKEQEQYTITKETIAIMNQKYHDLKHQISALRNASKEEINRYLDEIEESVRNYELIVKTGNEVLDIILTEKSIYCNNRGIQISCVADGSQMEFINTIDLYALLGNAIDNSIEAVEKLEKKEMRQIDLMIYRQQSFLIINIINPLEEKLIYEEDVPITTKGDRNYHGFGLRSMKHIVKKYDGYLDIREEDNCFSLKILIPIPNKE